MAPQSILFFSLSTGGLGNQIISIANAISFAMTNNAYIHMDYFKCGTPIASLFNLSRYDSIIMNAHKHSNVLKHIYMSESEMFRYKAKYNVTLIPTKKITNVALNSMDLPEKYNCLHVRNITEEQRKKHLSHPSFAASGRKSETQDFLPISQKVPLLIISDGYFDVQQLNTTPMERFKVKYPTLLHKHGRYSKQETRSTIIDAIQCAYAENVYGITIGGGSTLFHYISKLHTKIKNHTRPNSAPVFS